MIFSSYFRILSAFFAFVPFIFGIALPVALAQENTVRFEYLEQDLFPSWRGSESVPSHMEKIIQKMTPAEKEELAEHQRNIQTQQKRVNHTQIELEDEKRAFQKYQSQSSAFKGEVNEAKKEFEDCIQQKGRQNCQNEEAKIQLLIDTAQITDTSAPDRYEDIQHRYETEQQFLREQQIEYQNFLSRWHSLNMLPQGVLGQNCDGNFLLDYLPIFVKILFRIIAPIVLCLILYAGVRFIYSGDDESSLENVKKWFRFALIGILLMILSYSLLKATYFVFSTTEEEYAREQYMCQEYFTPTEFLQIKQTPAPTPTTKTPKKDQEPEEISCSLEVQEPQPKPLIIEHTFKYAKTSIPPFFYEGPVYKKTIPYKEEINKSSTRLAELESQIKLSDERFNTTQDPKYKSKSEGLNDEYRQIVAEQMAVLKEVCNKVHNEWNTAENDYIQQLNEDKKEAIACGATYTDGSPIEMTPPFNVFNYTSEPQYEWLNDCNNISF